MAMVSKQPRQGEDSPPEAPPADASDLAARVAALEAENEELRNDAARLDELCRYYLQVFEMAPIGYFICDSHGYVIRVNQALQRLLERDRRELLGQTFESFVEPESQARYSQQMAAILADGSESDVEIRLSLPDGRRIDANLVSVCYQDPLTIKRYTLSSIRDITERKHHEHSTAEQRRRLELGIRERTEQLEQALVGANQANQAKNMFLANMSHEIRTPLNAIQGMAFLLRSEGLNDKQQGYLGKMEAAARRLLDVLDAVLELSKISSGTVNLAQNSVFLDELLEEAAKTVHGRASAKGLRLEILPSGFHSSFIGDKARLQQALHNYLDNAIKFTREGTVSVAVRMESESEDNCRVRFEVTDSGPGIPEQDIDRLFSAFEQVDNSSTRRDGGPGLGLAITRRIAELMGGEAGVESTPGRGSTFWFTSELRCMPSSESETVLHLDAPSSEQQLLAEQFAGQQVLVVDDNLDSQIVTGALLREVKLHPLTASSGEEALQIARTHPDIALVLTDISMPGMDGFETTRELRKLPGFARRPIVALSAHTLASDRMGAVAAGMDDFVTKPIVPEALYRILLTQMAAAE